MNLLYAFDLAEAAAKKTMCLERSFNAFSFRAKGSWLLIYKEFSQPILFGEKFIVIYLSQLIFYYNCNLCFPCNRTDSAANLHT